MMALDRMALDDAGGNPERLAAAVLAQIPDVKLPVPIADIARALDITEIRYEPLDGLEACLITDAEKSQGGIIVNEASSRQRRRYSIGHELGHFLSPWHFPAEGGATCSTTDLRTTRGSERKPKWESEANRFAACALMPRSLVGTFLRGEPDLERALALASACDVSKEAAVRRYVDLNDYPLEAIFARNGVIRYVHKHKDFPKLKVWNGDKLPATAMALLASPGSVSAIEKVDWDDWIEWKRGGLTTQAMTQENGFHIVLLATEE